MRWIAFLTPKYCTPGREDISIVDKTAILQIREHDAIVVFLECSRIILEHKHGSSVSWTSETPSISGGHGPNVNFIQTAISIAHFMHSVLGEFEAADLAFAFGTTVDAIRRLHEPPGGCVAD